MHLYLHIPFCHEICPYCSFYKHKPGGIAQGEFIDALLTELDWQLDHYGAPQIETVYLGGGTPSLLSKKHLSQLFSGLNRRIPLAQCQEVAMEANPSTFNQEKADLFPSLGITRVSLGVQSFDPDQLQILGRDHSPAEAVQAFHILREAGVPAVNLDLMFSTPGQTVASWETTLDQAIALRPDHLSCYNLTYEEDTAYFEKFISGDYTDEPEKNETLFSLADRKLSQAGYLHYETSNYALPGAESVHNRGYWRGNPYLGVGPSAVGCVNRERRKNISDTAAYIQQVSQVGHALEEHELLDDEAWRLERLALQLRTIDGIPLSYASPSDPTPLIDHGLLSLEDGILKTTAQGAPLVDSIVEYLA